MIEKISWSHLLQFAPDILTDRLKLTLGLTATDIFVTVNCALEHKSYVDLRKGKDTKYGQTKSDAADRFI